MFIVVEGADGTGTTTQSKLLVDRLLGAGHSAIWTCEPYKDGVLEVAIRKMLAGDLSGNQKVELALLFAANRLRHLREVVVPNIEKGVIVVSDRYYLSSLVYQGLSFPREWIADLNKHILVPDHQVVLDVSLEETERRISSRDESLEIFDKKEFRKDIRQSYRDSLRNRRPYYSNNPTLVDGTLLSGEGTLEEVSDRIWAHLGFEISDEFVTAAGFDL